MIDFVSILKDEKIKGVIHIGVFDASEKKEYNKLGVNNIVWIEANPSYYEKIKSNVGDDLVIIAAVGNENKETFFNISNNGQSSSILELGLHSKEHPDIIYNDKIKVEMKRMINIIEQYNLDIDSYNFLNLDVQGYELEVLKGFEDLIQKFDIIYSEINEKELYINSPLVSDIDEYLSQFGFQRTETFMTSHGWGDAIYLKK